MEKLNLSGVWSLRDLDNQISVEGNLPGCNYLDLMKHGICKDPFWGENERELTVLAKKDYEYVREFNVSAELLQEERIDLVISGLDTLAEVTINNKQIARTDNVHRIYRFSIKNYLNENSNQIRIIFRSPLPYLEDKNKNDKIPFSSGMGVDGISHLRKVQCHFGWDWGPILPPVGINGYIELQGYTFAKIDQVTINQNHDGNKVLLNLETKIHIMDCGVAHTFQAMIRITSPLGEQHRTVCELTEGYGKTVFEIFDPQLWWCNGLGQQNLYQVDVTLSMEDEILDSWKREIGLRTIELDTTKDEWGYNFRFLMNGVPIFAKGADWIPSDSFITRTSNKDLAFYIHSAHDANMNMLRVWGGGYYESDAFYDLCDKYGILVWQDFGFACAPYPFYDSEFLINVEAEVRDNIRRLRHHASLALWCGNNEIELIAMMWKKNKKLYEANIHFFHDLLPQWVKEEDRTTAYWPGSPNSGTRSDKPNDFGKGDTHLWQIWHGMMPIEHFRKMPTRFCSEFGMESLPSMKTIRSFTDKREPNIFDPVMLAHQKSKGGNQKMLFYLLAKYRNPTKLEDFIYLSQLVQSETVREATEEWKRNLGRCNGAIYWQYNDCWPVASWAGIDYGKQFKAVMYKSKQFNSLLSASVDITKDSAMIYVVNEYPQVRNVTLKCSIEDLEGSKVWEKNRDVKIGATTASKELDVLFTESLKGYKKENVVLIVSLLEDEKTIFEQTRLIVPDKEAFLKSPQITKSVRIEGKKGLLTLSADRFARYVYVEIDGIDTPFSDNYFDLRRGKPYTISFDIPQNFIPSAIEKHIKIKSLADIPYKGNRLNDVRLRMMMRLHKDNFLAWIMFKFI
jgi:beta-mannosidase